MRHFDYAISVGKNCRCAYQLRRFFGREAAPSTVFDWQLTRRRSLLAYIERDFEGIFNLADLAYDERHRAVENTRFGTRHRHEFPVDVTSPAAIAEHYETARSRHDYLAKKTLGLFRGRHALLFCFSEPVTTVARWRLTLALRLKYPQLRFRLLGGAVDVLDDPEQWRGTDAVWDRHFAGLHVVAPADADA